MTSSPEAKKVCPNVPCRFAAAGIEQKEWTFANQFRDVALLKDGGRVYFPNRRLSLRIQSKSCHCAVDMEKKCELAGQVDVNGNPCQKLALNH